jgi:glycerate kinase
MTDTRAVSSIRGIPDSVLVAPDSFKGTLTAVEVADAIGAGVRAAGHDADVCPVADGGEGTLDVLAPALDLARRTESVSDPLGRVIEATFAIGGREAVIETAAATGLGLVPESQRDAVKASSAGTGELIVAAARAGAKTIYLGVGGSASTDGGSGALDAIRRAGGLGGVKLVVLCDVRTSFEDAARVFAPQKGASREQVRTLTARLNAAARRLPRDPRGVAMTGAAGGLSGGLWAALGAELVAGASFVLDAIGFDARMRAARAIVTGEGRLDSQSLAGKAVSEIATRARQSGVPCHAIVGVDQLDSFGARILDLETVTEAGSVVELRAAGRKLAAAL